MTAVASLAPCRAMARGTGPSKRSNRPSSRALGNSALNTRGIARGERGTRGKSSRVASSNEDDEPPAPEPLLVIVEVDGVLCDVHCDLHRLAFNEAFVELGMEGASWSEERYLSLLRTGGGTAEGMVERYFHFYGYPTPELRDPTAHIPDEVGQAAMSISGSMRPAAWNAEGASVAAQAAAIQAAEGEAALRAEPGWASLRKLGLNLHTCHACRENGMQPDRQAAAHLAAHDLCPHRSPLWWTMHLSQVPADAATRGSHHRYEQP